MRQKTIEAIIKHTCFQCGCPELARNGRVKVNFSNRLTVSLAYADYDYTNKSGSITISSVLWKSLSIYQKIELIVHETCHVVADHMFEDARPHGREWKMLMMCAGIGKPSAYIEV